MKRFLLLLCVGVFSFAKAQTKADSIRMMGEMVKFFDLGFTDAELDSMMEGVKENYDLYRKMHKLYPPNDLPFPFAFHPAPYGMNITRTPQTVSMPLHLGVQMPAKRDELAFYSIPQLAGLLKTKKISSVQLTQFFIDRLKQWGDTLECVITLTEEIAMQQARQADEEIKNGKYRGLLHGIPYGLKDLFAVKGTKTTWGSTPYKDQVINEDAFVYKQLKNAGAVLCAKLSLGALAYDNKWFGGFTRNPWNLQGGSSGSSAGSAAATSAGLLPFAIGTETWGSIVSPSTRCGVTGLRPTFGSVSRYGGMVLCWSLDKIGPICRSAEDAAIVFNYIKGTDGKDASAVDKPFNYNGKVDFKKLRIAYAENYFKRLQPEALEWKVLEIYRALGADPQPVTFPDSTIYPFDIMGIVLGAEAAAAFDELTRTNRDDLIERQDKNFWPNIFRTARTIPAVEYINANRYRYTLCKEMNEFLKNYDAVIVPSFGGNQLAMTNLTGHPVVCMPIGFNQRGLPASITIIGNLYSEATILAVAKAFQEKTEHHKKQPPKFAAK